MSNAVEPVPNSLEMGRLQPKGSAWPAVVAAVCLSLFVVKAVTSMVQESATWDEPRYFGIGKYLLQHGQWDVQGCIAHPPLSFYIHSIPLLFVQTDPSVWESASAGRPTMSDTARGDRLLASQANKGDRLLNLARLMMVLTAVLLGYFVYSWSAALYGRWSAVLAVLLFSFCPNILANARLITPDITLATFWCGTLFFLWRMLRNGRIRDAMIGGICFGLALLSKFPSLLLGPIGVGLVMVWALRTKYDPTSPPPSSGAGSNKAASGTLSKREPIVRLCLIFALIALAVLWLGYGMNCKPYFAGIEDQERRSQQQFQRFLMGNYSRTGWWYYFLVAFSIKTPMAALLFMGVAGVLYLKRWRAGEWLDEVFLLAPAVALFCYFSVHSAQVGLRYMLPAYPLLYVFASGAARFCFATGVRRALSTLAIVWYIGASIWIHPDYLAYFNEFIGGPRNGWKYLVDSNLDWGQDLKGLKKFMDEHGIAKVKLSYFGTDLPERYGINYEGLPSFFLPEIGPRRFEVAHRGWFAVSASNLQGVYLSDKDTFAWLRNRPPDASIGYSIFLYNLDKNAPNETR